MSGRTWQETLQGELARRPNNLPRVAIVGIGHELRGDDAAGIEVARGLVLPTDLPVDWGSVGSTVLVLEGGAAPENTTGALRRFKPDFVLLVDAAGMGEPAGSVRWLDPLDAAGFSASTHMLPLHMLAEYLNSELGCEVALLGIQPETLDVGAGLSQTVRQAVDGVIRDLRRII